MSHLPERAEKICLNCNTPLYGRYCHNCSQENVEPREGFWHMVTHFFFDLFHFDGKFIKSLKYLLFSPGFLSSEHIKGKRANYLHPIRMYVFTSAFFFLIFFGFFQNEQKKFIGPNRSEEVKKELQKNKKGLTRALKMVSVIKDSSLIDSLQRKIAAIDGDIKLLNIDSANVVKLRTFDINKADSSFIQIDNNDAPFISKYTYDSIQQSLPDKEKDGFLQRAWKHQVISLRENHNNNNNEIGKAIVNKLIHLFPQMMFSSLPLVSLLLLLFYVRRKKFYYADHLVFNIHFICAFFIFILCGLIVDSLYFFIFGSNIPFFNTIMFFLLMYYLYSAMRNFYGQSIGKTILKLFMLLITSIILVLPLLFAFFIFISLFTAH